MTGVNTTNLDSVPTIDSVLGNRDGNTVQIAVELLAALIAAQVPGPQYETRATLYADLDWPANTRGVVWGDATEAYHGVYKKSGASGAGSWARIGDLPMTSVAVAALAAKAPLDSPPLTGTPTAPTPASSSNDDRLATTAFVQTVAQIVAQAAVDALVAAAPGQLDTLNEIAAALGNDANFAATITAGLAGKAPLASPALTGTPTVPTAAPGTNTTQVASTAFVQAAAQAAVNALVAAAPGQLDTLNEIAAALGNDANFAATITAGLAGKASTASLTLETSRAQEAEAILRAVQQVLAQTGIYALPTNNLGLVTGIVDAGGRVLWGQRPSGTVYEGGFVRSVFSANNLDMVGEVMTDAEGRVLSGTTAKGGAYVAGLLCEPLGENSLDAVGDVYVDADGRVVFGVTSGGQIIGLGVLDRQGRLEMIIVTGQSLAEGGANLAITTVPPYPDGEALKFANGPVGKQAEIIGPGLVALAEQTNETVSTGIARRVLADHPDMAVLLAGQAWGGRTLAEISLAGGLGIYEAIQAQMDTAAAHPSGAVIRACVLIHGEADGIISNTTYDIGLKAYQRQFARDAMTRTGQAEIPVLLTCQTSSAAGYRGNVATRDSFTTPFLQLKASVDHPEIVLIGPKYHLTYIDHAHIDALSTRLWGEKFGQVWRQVCIEKRHWRPLSPATIAVDGSDVIIDLHVPFGPVVADTSAVTDPGNLGFNLMDAAGATITSVTITGDSQITVSLSAPPVPGWRLSYAFHNGTAGFSGWDSGARGCIRDSDPTLSIYSGQPMPNWLVAFQHTF